MSALAVLAAVLVLMSAVMAVGWTKVVASRNGGWTDVFWSFGVGAAALVSALAPAPGQAWDAPAPRAMLVATLAALWSLRLGTYLAGRVARGPEDVRYAEFRRLWGADFNRRAFRFLQTQALAAVVLCLSILLAARRPGGLGLQDAIGIGVLAAAILGEALADAQLKAFKADPAHRGQVCQRGLWAWSRHPNYFFDWLGWLAYPILAIDLSGAYPQGLLALAGPAFMYLVLTRMTGVPPLEAAMLRSRGDAYRAYQARVSTFLPLPPKPQRSPE